MALNRHIVSENVCIRRGMNVLLTLWLEIKFPNYLNHDGSPTKCCDNRISAHNDYQNGRFHGHVLDMFDLSFHTTLNMLFGTQVPLSRRLNFLFMTLIILPPSYPILFLEVFALNKTSYLRNGKN